MTSEIKASCAEFAANPVAGGVKWRQLDNKTKFVASIAGVTIMLCAPFIHESQEFRFLITYGLSPFDYDETLLGTLDARLAAEKAISLCRERVEKMYNEFQKLEGQ